MLRDLMILKFPECFDSEVFDFWSVVACCDWSACEDCFQRVKCQLDGTMLAEEV